MGQPSCPRKPRGKSRWPHCKYILAEWTVRHCSCPECGAEAGQPCISLANQIKGPIKKVHRGRVKAFRKLQQKRRWRRKERKRGPRKHPRKKKQRKLGPHDCNRELYYDTLRREIARNGGHIGKIAWSMNVVRHVVYSWFYKWGLWPEVNAARIARLTGEATVETEETDLIRRTRLALR